MEEKENKSLKFAQQIYDSGTNNVGQIYDQKNNSKLTSDQIQTYLNSPYTNVDQLQSAIDFFINMNGILKEIITYKSNILTYDHYLLCTNIDKYKSKDKFDKAYYKAVTELKKFSIKFNVRWMMERLFKDGELYVYVIEGKDNVTIAPFPPSYCKVVGATGGLQHFAINMNKISDKNVVAFPLDIQDIYESKKNGTIKNDENYDNSTGFYELDHTKAFAFSMNYLYPKNIPYYSAMLKDLCRISDLSDEMQEASLIENFKLIQMLIPTDKETGEPLVDAEEAILYHSDVKNTLPSGIACVGLPYELTSINLGDSAGKTLQYMDNLVDGCYNTAGINDQLFNGSINNTQAVTYSAVMDSLQPLKFLEAFRLFFNAYFLNNSALKNFELVFLDSTAYNKDAKLTSLVSNAATFTSKLQILAGMGLEPHQAWNMLKQEELMQLDDEMNPMQNSHTQSSDDVGRPTASEESGDINKTGESTNV